MNSPQICYLYGFESPRPKYSVLQDDGRGWIEMAQGRTLALNDSPKIEKLEHYVNKYTVTSDRISKRGTELKDFTKKSLDDNQIFYFRDRFLGASLEERMQFFSKVVTQKASEVFEKHSAPPEHLIHTTCTGYL